MARLLTTLTLLVALLFPAAAGAAVTGAHHSHARTSTHRGLAVHRSLEKVARRGPVALATAVAELYWNAVPCGGQIRVLGNQAVPSSLEYGTDAWVTFSSSLGQNNLEAPAASYTQCTISLAHWQWPTQKAMKSDWNMFCLTVTHEVGHLLGYKHTLAPGAVMAPVFTNESNVPEVCRATRQLGMMLAGSARTR